jgi:hypothetical protein
VQKKEIGIRFDEEAKEAAPMPKELKDRLK